MAPLRKHPQEGGDIIPIRREPRPGLPDGTSVPGVYVARWIDETTGSHWVRMEATSGQQVRDILDPLVNNNTLTIEGPL